MNKVKILFKIRANRYRCLGQKRYLNYGNYFLAPPWELRPLREKVFIQVGKLPPKEAFCYKPGPFCERGFFSTGNISKNAQIRKKFPKEIGKNCFARKYI